MSTVSDLMGLGFPGPLAGAEGFSPQALTTTGTSSTTAAAITGSAVVLATAGSQTGAILPATWPLWKPIVITCPTATTAIVYPDSGGTLNGGTATSGGQNLAQTKTMIVFKVASLTWVSVLTA